MAFDFHIIQAPDGGAPYLTDRVILGQQNNLSNASGATNTAVSTAVSFPAFSLPVDGSGNALYGVHVQASQAAFVAVTNKNASGFNVVLTPVSSTAAIAAGTFDVLVTA